MALAALSEDLLPVGAVEIDALPLARMVLRLLPLYAHSEETATADLGLVEGLLTALHATALAVAAALGFDTAEIAAMQADGVLYAR